MWALPCRRMAGSARATWASSTHSGTSRCATEQRCAAASRCLRRSRGVALRRAAQDMILVGGENVYCAEVEAALAEHAAVAQAAVFGVPNDVLGETVTGVRAWRLLPRALHKLEAGA